MAALPGAWHYRVSAGTGQPGVSMLWLGEVESLICSFFLSVAACKLVWADPSLRYTSMLLGRSATNTQASAPSVSSWIMFVAQIVPSPQPNVSEAQCVSGPNCPLSVSSAPRVSETFVMLLKPKPYTLRLMFWGHTRPRAHRTAPTCRTSEGCVDNFAMSDCTTGDGGGVGNYCWFSLVLIVF